MRTFLISAVMLVVASMAACQERQAKSQPVTRLLLCGSLIQPANGQVQHNVLIAVEGDRIREVGDGSHVPSGAQAIDLSDHTCLPGLIDAHTHVLLQGDITAAEYDEQLLKQSVAYGTILATRSVRRALEYGFTTIRDLETEGAGHADVDLKKAINRGIIPGPRMQVATRAMDVTGAYPLLGYAPEVPVPHGVQVVDGPDNGRKAVREQISYGADWIKVYSDRSYFVRPDGVLDDIPTFTLDELKAMVQKGIYYVPTIYVGEYVAQGRAAAGAKVWMDMIKIHGETFRRAVNAGVKIAFGTDAGGFDWGIDPAIEFPYMVKYGMTPAQAIRAATTTPAEMLG